MKLRKMLTALLLAAGVVFVAGWKQADSPSEVVKKFFAAMVKFDFATAAKLSCGEQSAGMAALAEDQNKFIGSMKASAKNGNEKAKILVKVYEKGGFVAVLEYLAEQGDKRAKQQVDRIKKFKLDTKGETIDGDFAEIDVVISGGPGGKSVPDKAYAKKVNGEWKVIKEEEYKRERSVR